MRMWNVPPPLMCRQHFLGEHKELHMFVGHLNRGRQLGKYAEGLCQVSDLPRRHAELVEEFERRGYNHDSPLPEIINYEGPDGWVFDVEHNLRELARRCPECARIQAHARIERLSKQRLIQDRSDCLSDISICEWALLLGVNEYSRGSVQERLDRNKRIVCIINRELERRAEVGYADV